MAMNDPTLSRPMFQRTPSTAPAPMVPTVGIGSMTTPDQNAMALRNMFAPQPAYKRGGEVIDGVAHFQAGGEGVAPAVNAPTEEPGWGMKLLEAAKDIKNLPYQIYQGVVGGEPVSLTPNYDENIRRPRGETGVAPTSPAQKFGAAAADIVGLTVRGPQYVGNIIDPKEVPPVKSITPNYDVYRDEEAPAGAYKDVGKEPAPSGIASLDEAVARMSPEQLKAIQEGKPLVSAPPPPPPDPLKESIQTNLQAIKARREASDKQREENKNLALLSAGLGMMAGTNRNAFANIGAGGQQGIATFAGLEKARREDDASRRQEQYQQDQLTLQNRQLAQQREIAFAQIEKDPDTIRLYRALGGGDLVKGYQLVSSDAILKAAQALSLDPTATLEERTKAKAFVESRISEAMGARSGAGQFSGFKDVTAK